MSTDLLTPRTQKRYGWKPDPPDHRDFLYAVQRPDKIARPLPEKVDLRFKLSTTGTTSSTPEPNMPEPYDQGQTSSCTANAIAGACEYLMRKEGLINAFSPSRLFIYWNERFMENSVGEDGGAMIRDGVKVISKIGFCSERVWPFSADLSIITKKPDKVSYDEARLHLISAYMRLRTIDEMRGCLADGYPFTLGMSVYESFEGKQISVDGILKVPLPNERMLGGHAVLVVGYDDNEHRFIIRNSWGKSWGQGGYFTAPYAFVSNRNYCQDFWTLRRT